MIKANKKQAKALAKLMDEIAKGDETEEFEISQDQYRRLRPSTITVYHNNRSGKFYRIDKIKPSGEHARGEV